MAGATGTADAVDMDLRILGHLVVDDGAQILDIQPAGGHIGGYQHPAALVGKAHQHLIPLPLLQIAMQRQHRDAAGAQGIVYRLALALGVAEDDAGVWLVVAQQVQQRRAAGTALHFDKALLDMAAIVGCLHAHLYRIPLYAGADARYLFGIGGGEEQGLALFGGLTDHIRHHIGKAHIQHAIGFIQYQHLQMIQREALTAQVILDAPRCAHHDMGRMHQRVQLRPHGYATAQGEDLDIGGKARQTAQLLAYLIRQLAGRAEHQCLGAIVADIEAAEQPYAEGGGLATAGLGFGYHILALEDQRQRLGLDRGHGGVAKAGQVLQLLIGQIQAGEIAIHRCLVSKMGPTRQGGDDNRLEG